MITEILITVEAAITTTLIVLLLAIRNAVHKRRLRKNLDLLETASRSNTDAAHFEALKSEMDSAYINRGPSGAATFKISLELAFSLAVLLGFSWWTFVLFTKDLLIWASVSAFFAVIGLVLPFLIWRETKQRDEIKNRIGRTISQFEKKLSESAGRPSSPSPSSVISQPEPVNETMATPSMTIQHEAKAPVPEDSVLRRHLLTELRAKIEASLFPRPTDCVLQRHYEQLIESELENRLLNPEVLQRFKYINGIESSPITEAKPAATLRTVSEPVDTITSESNVTLYHVPED